MEEPLQDVVVQRGADTRELPCSPDTDTQSKAVKKKAPVPAPGSVRGEIQEWRGGVWKWNILN